MQRRSLSAALALLALLAAFLAQYSSGPDLVLVGNVTIDIVDGKRSLGGAVSYAAAVATAWGKRACVVTANADDADLGSLFKGHDLVVVQADRTLVFEHSYTFWGNHRKLRVTAQPNVTLTMQHLPARCRRAHTLLLGPLMPQDMDPSSFVQRSPPWWQRLLGLRGQQVGLMAQGLQRSLDSSGRVKQLATPSRQLEDALGPSTLVFLSDVETDVWPNGTLPALAARTHSFMVTRGAHGADVFQGGSMRHSPIGQVDVVLDTNGAGDSFATAFMLAAADGHPDPAAVAHWAAGMAVTQPQACKPACVTMALRNRWATKPAPSGLRWSALHCMLLSPLQQVARLLGLVAPGASRSPAA